jgi:hypothetical protein
MRIAAGLAWVIVAETLLVGSVTAAQPDRAAAGAAAQAATLRTFDIPARSIQAAGGAVQPAIGLDDLRLGAAAAWRVDRAVERAAAAAAAKAAAKAKAEAKAAARAAAKAAKAAKEKAAVKRHNGSGGGGGGSASYNGRNRFWFPSLGINQSVSWFPCSRSTAPGNAVYRWGCAGSNNVYLMAHDFGRFYPLYKAYKNGRLRDGMLAVYNGPNGNTHYYRLSFYRVVAPDGDVGWAYASQSQPSLTLQTCVSGGAKRLVVRFREVSKP